MPSAIEEVHRDFKDQGLVVIAINLGENRAVVAAWATDKKLSMPVLLDRELAAYRAYQIAFTPTVFLVGRDGKLVGKAVGQAAEGAALAAAMRADIAALAAAAGSLPKPRTFYEVDATLQIYGPADDSFLAEIVGLAGGSPVTSGSADNFEIPLERLIAADPEVIILGDAAFGTTADAVAKRPGWGVMTAVRAGAVRVADDKLITQPGPRLAQGLRSLILAIHPGAALP